VDNFFHNVKIKKYSKNAGFRIDKKVIHNLSTNNPQSYPQYQLNVDNSRKIVDNLHFIVDNFVDKFFRKFYY